MKTCKKCNQSKPFSAFPPNERYAGGYGTWCKECHRLANREWYLSNAEANKARAAAWRRDNPDAVAAINKRHKDANKVRLAQIHADWAAANKDKRRATSAKRKAARLRATPAWADMRAIGEVYAEAMRQQEETGIRKHVDHIVPLQSRLVCGLHVPANLQILDGAENESKRNRRWPDMP